jgi:penicillin-binding protein 1A
MTKRAMSAAGAARSRGRSRPRQAVRRSSFKKRLKTFFAVSFLAVETAIAIALVGVLTVFWKFSTDMPNVEQIVAEARAPVPTTIWSDDGVLLGTLDVENRQPVPLDEISKNAVNATVAIEDHRFYEHPGVDPQGILRAVVANTRDKNLGQGGSTLTQQLVRNLHISGISTEKKYSRKLREALTALRLEQVYTKPDILRMYLNSVPYGAGAIGIQAASKTYFGKSASKLDLAEAALLAGLPQRPSELDPFDHLDAALHRRDEVLDAMQRYGYITAKAAEAARAEKPRLIPRRRHKNFNFKAPYFVEYVRRMLTKRYGSDFVFSGLKIETTLNWKIQQDAEKALREGLENVSGFGANQGALVSLDPNTGYIRAMVGGRSFHAEQYNAVTQGRRQPGSTFKLFDYSAAFDTGACTLNSTFEDRPFEYPGDPKHRVVHNYSPGYTYASMSCLEGIKHSVNTIAVQVAYKVGIRTVIAYAEKMGITTKLDPYLPTALGASAVRPLDLCSAYSVLPEKGDRYVPMAIVRVTDSEGSVIEEHTPLRKTGILKPETVDQMNTALEAVVTSGTGTRARGTEENGIVENAHGKTGTTSDSRDAWFAGYTPELTSVVWVASVHRGSHGRKTYASMPGATGGGLCAPIWHNFMIKAVPEQRKFHLMQQIAMAEPEPVKAADTASDKKRKENAERARKDAADRAAQKDGFRPVADPSAPDADPDVTPSQQNSSGQDSGTDNGPTPAVPSNDVQPDTSSNRALASPTSPPPTVPNTPAPASASAAPPVTAPTRAVSAASPPPARAAAPAAPEMTSVLICVDSGARATQWCPATKTVRMTVRQARRLRRCRLHRPPPGEE